MIFDIKEALNPIEFKETPRFNETSMPSSGAYMTQPMDYKQIVAWMRKTPECIGIFRALATDIVSDGWWFEPVNNDKKGGKKNIKRAEDFCARNFFKQEFMAMLYDWMMLGNGAMWKGNISNSAMKELFDESMIKFKEENPEFTSSIGYKEVQTTFWDEGKYDQKQIRHVAWSTMNIDLTEDRKGIKRFRQMVSAEHYTEWNPEEIIHAKFMNFDGKVYGMTPIESCWSGITTLGLIKDYAGYFFENGGVPNWMFMLPKELAGSPNHEALKQHLSEYNATKNRHRNLVFTGEVDTQQMNKFDKDMEFRQLAMYYTGILALAFNMPLNRVATILAEKKASTSAEDLSDAGYWRSISTNHDYFETLFNTQLFIPEFGVRIKFNRSYKQDEVRETQTMVQKVDIIDKLLKMDIVNEDWIYRYLAIHPDDRSKGKIKAIEQQGPDFRQNLKKDKKVIPGEAQQSFSAAKTAEQTKEKPEVKEMMNKTNYLDIDMGEFEKVFSYWVQNSETRKVNWYEDSDTYVLMIHTPDENFRAVVSKKALTRVLRSHYISGGRRILN